MTITTQRQLAIRQTPMPNKGLPMVSSEFNDSVNAIPTSQPDVKDLNKLLQLYGVAENYIDYAGNCLDIPFASRLKILALMGVNVDNATSVSNALHEQQFKRFGRTLPAMWIVPCGCEASMPLVLSSLPVNDFVEWTITLEQGELIHGTASLSALPKENLQFGTEVYVRLQLPIPAVVPGYHQLSLNMLGETLQTQLVASPARCFEPEWVQQQNKLSGISVQLYSLRSNRNWGIGDFTDLMDLVNHLAAHQVDFLVLNPLHLLDANHPEHCSPYSPMDRRFINPIYIDPEREPDFFENSPLCQKVNATRFQNQLEAVRETNLVDYLKVTKLKYDVFSKMFRYFRKHHLNANTERGDKFRQFVAIKGESGRLFAQYQAKHTGFSLWHIRDPQFHLYLQWLAETQLESCQQAAQHHGMRLGLIRDLAVGSHTNSIEVQLNSTLFSLGASVGAPPDPLAPQGQNWGLPPINPIALQDTGYAHFIELLRANMVHCGALRIDHVMALMRLWWCPGSENDGDGAYVHYPAEDLFALLRLESLRNQCVVIGEDLGVVPPKVREFMHTSGVFSNALFYFEKYDPVHFKKPEHFAFTTLTMVANHDVPTLKAWWQKTDLQTRFDIGLMDEEQLQAAIASRESDLIQILHWLNDLSLLPENWRDFNIHHPFDPGLASAIMRANGLSNSRLVSVQLDDLCLLETPVNIPGTSTEYPNWRRKLSHTTDSLFASPQVLGLMSDFVAARSQ